MGVFGSSRVMEAVMDLAKVAAGTRSSVLIIGERGTGREMVARTIHALAGRPAAPFIKIDCARANGDLEVELFGLRAPARQGGATDRLPFERISRSSLLSHGRAGTIFFERLEDMPMRVQARLARILRDGEAVVSDSIHTIEVDARGIASVPPTFEEWVQEGIVRADLFQRLSLIRIELPPLRNRREDIPYLATHFLHTICAERGLPMKTISAPATALLAALPWPGNAQELARLLERVVLLVSGPTVELQDVLANVNLEGHASTMAYGGTLREARERFERDYIAAILGQCHGRMSETAKLLGIQRTHLYRKVRHLQVSRPARRNGNGARHETSAMA
jgi:DNA-binding NtrC family response regulator